MALMLHQSSFTTTTTTTNKQPHLHLLHRPPYHSKPTSLSFCPVIKSQKQQEDSSSSSSSTTTSDSSKKPPADSSSPGLGFGSSTKKPQSKGKKERAPITRRQPFEKPSFATPQTAAQSEELKKNESAFLLTWSGLGGIILLQGIALSASGFLPEAWDDIFVKYLYPSFTPTVFLFVAGSVTYGVLKYLQNEKSNTEN